MLNDADQFGGIEEAAYELYVQKGRVDGDDLNDWFLAERMISEKPSSASDETVLRGTAASKSNKRKTK